MGSRGGLWWTNIGVCHVCDRTMWCDMGPDRDLLYRDWTLCHRPRDRYRISERPALHKPRPLSPYSTGKRVCVGCLMQMKLT